MATASAPPAGQFADSDYLREWHRQQSSQIELDLQQHVLAALQSERDLALADRVHYATLYEQAPAGYLSLDAAGRIVRANHAAAELLGQASDVLAGMALERFVASATRPRVSRFLAGLFASGQRAVLELTLTPLAGGGAAQAPRRLRIEANLDSVAQRARLILTDLGTAGRRDATRQRALEVLDSIGEGVLVCDSAQRIVSVNPAFTRITGYPAEDVLGRTPGFLLRAGAADGQQYARALQALRRGSRWLGEPEGRRRDGGPYIAALSLTAVYDDDGGIAHFIAVFSDITARRQEEKAREQLSRLAAHQEMVREEERQRIAREVHDELGQNLLALRLEIAQLQARAAPADGRLRQRVDAALENVDSTIRSVRGIMNQLRPAVLDLGLHAALEWQVQQFRQRTGLACTLALPPEACMPALPAPIALALFRNLQEALDNVGRHAQADAVEVCLALDGGALALSVSDDGVGLDPASYGGAGAFGLITMQQRMVALDGSMSIDRPPAGRGCRLTLSFDL